MSIAAEAVWQDRREDLLRYISRRVRTPEDAEDILQEVMLRVHRHAGGVVHPDRMVAWVYRVAGNAIADHHRKPVRREVPFGDSTDLPDTREPASTDVSVGLAGCLPPLMTRLPETYRQALALTELAGATQAQAAERLGLSVSGMKARVQRGRRRLRDLLLDCCDVDLDVRGHVTDYRARSGSCASFCGCTRLDGHDRHSHRAGRNAEDRPCAPGDR